MSEQILYTVFAPTRPLSRTRWNYQQNVDGSVVRFLTLKNGRETPPDLLATGEAFPDALSWARCLHGDKPHFDCAEAQEIYSTLHNVVRHVHDGEKYGKLGASVCLEGIIADCQEWLNRLKEEEVAA